MRKINLFDVFLLLCFSAFSVFSSKGGDLINLLGEKAGNMISALNVEKLVDAEFYRSYFNDLIKETERFNQIRKLAEESLPSERDADYDAILPNSGKFQELLGLELKIDDLGAEAQDKFDDITIALAERVNDLIKKVRELHGRLPESQEERRVLIQPIFSEVFNSEIEKLRLLNDELESAINEYNYIARDHHRDEL